MNTTRKGFTIVEFVLILVVVAVIGFLGYRFFSAMDNKQAATAPATTADVATVKKAADLTTVSKQLDSVDVAGSFSNELDAAASF